MKQNIVIAVLVVLEVLTLGFAGSYREDNKVLNKKQLYFKRYIESQKSLLVVQGDATRKENCSTKEQYYSSEEYYLLKKAKEENQIAFNLVKNF